MQYIPLTGKTLHEYELNWNVNVTEKSPKLYAFQNVFSFAYKLGQGHTETIKI